jgi:hypothetical protein
LRMKRNISPMKRNITKTITIFCRIGRIPLANTNIRSDSLSAETFVHSHLTDRLSMCLYSFLFD